MRKDKEQTMKNFSTAFIALVACTFLGIAWAGGGSGGTGGMPERSPQDGKNKELSQATFAGGCFWCTEAFFQELEGVYQVTSGYIGGQVENPTYEQVCSGTTGHAEAIRLLYNPEEISYSELLEVHFRTHDPTTLNRQGADRGTQYRSAIFYHDAEQKKVAEEVIAALTKEKVYQDPIVTEVSEATTWYPAENYHQNFYANNPNQGYCRAVIAPKMEKFRKVFADKLREPSGKK